MTSASSPVQDAPATGSASSSFNSPLAQADPEVAAAIDQELLRQQNTLEMIASENFAPVAADRKSVV